MKIQQSIWYKTRPEQIRKMIDQWPPNKKYLLLNTGADYYILDAYSSNGTVAVTRFDHHTNKPLFQVFGIDPNKLIEVEIDDIQAQRRMITNRKVKNQEGKKMKSDKKNLTENQFNKIFKKDRKQSYLWRKRNQIKKEK